MICFPDTDMIIIENAGNNEMFQQSDFFRLVKKYFGKNFRPGAAQPFHSRETEQLRIAKENLRYYKMGRSKLPVEKCCRSTG